jgi:hypothetical protein
MEKNGQMPHAASVVKRATMGSRGGEREDVEGRRWSGRAGGVRARKAAEPTLLSASANWETDGTRTDVNLTRSEGPTEAEDPCTHQACMAALACCHACTLARSLHTRLLVLAGGAGAGARRLPCVCVCGFGSGEVRSGLGRAGQGRSGSGLRLRPSALAASCTSTTT